MQTIKDQFNDFLQRGGVAVLEYPVRIDGKKDTIDVYIDVLDEGVEFIFYPLGLPTFFDGDTVEISEGRYLVPFDDCFTDLDHYLQYIGEDIRIGFIAANGINAAEAD